jgi:Tfp pilus assembly protein PilV
MLLLQPPASSLQPVFRGIALLEVVLALSIFVGMAIAVLGGLSVCIRSAGDLRLQAQATDLAVSVVSEIEMGVTPAADAGPTAFDKPYDAWTWQTTLASGPTTGVDGADLTQVEVVVYNADSSYTYRLYEMVPSGEASAVQMGDPSAVAPSLSVPAFTPVLTPGSMGAAP